MSPGVIRPFEPADAATSFRCGVHALDDFFARHSATNERNGVCRTYVYPGERDGSPTVLGFYTLSMADVEAAEVAPAMSVKLPRYALPVALVGRLAVDERARGRRIGAALVVDALQRALSLAQIIGCLGVIVDAKDANAQAF